MARLSEAEGRALLRELFTQAGYAIVEDYRLAEHEISVTLDGFDPARRVGYEYITSRAGDRAELGPGVVGALEARMAKGELHLLLLDERDAADAESLRSAAREFLRRVGPAGGR